MEGYFEQLYLAIRNNEIEEVKKFSSNGVDLTRHYGNEGNFLNIALDHTGVDMLAVLLGVGYPIEEEFVCLPEEKYVLVNLECDAEGNSPLMKAVKTGKLESASLLITCGAEVNFKTHGGRERTALDYALDRLDSETTLLLLKNDSLLLKMNDSRFETGSEWILNGSEELKEFWRVRDGIHKAIEEGRFDCGLREDLEKEANKRTHYLVGSKGESALYKAGVKRNYDAWAYLLGKGMEYANRKEREDVETEKQLSDEMFNRALEKLLYKVKGCHVMKMVSKAIVFGRNAEEFGKKVERFFRILDEDEVTSSILKVLQDVRGFEIAFDFDSTNVGRMLAVCSSGTLGLTDFKRNRVYVGAMETDTFGIPELVSNLAHELSHKAMSVVFRNGGLPYHRGDHAREKEYTEVVKTVLSPEKIAMCDDIIHRVVKSYDSSLYGKELIVRVPEMTAKYGANSDIDDGKDGISRLRTQAAELLMFFERFVMPELNRYVNQSDTSNKITGRAVIEYQKLLSIHQGERIYVNDNISAPSLDTHNDLRVLRVSNLKLGQSHVKNFLKKQGKEVLFVDFSVFHNCKDVLVDGMRRREFETLAVIWDSIKAPKFCSDSVCWRESCPAYCFGDYQEGIIMLVDKAWSVLDGVKAVEYEWYDISQKTRDLILGKKMNFGGKILTVKNIFQSIANGECLDQFIHDFLDSSGISLLLDESDIRVGEPVVWSSENPENKIFLSHPGCLMIRSLSQRFVPLNTEILQKSDENLFFISNVSSAHLCQLGIKEELISVWDPNRRKHSTRCYVVDPEQVDCNVYDVFEDIVNTVTRDYKTMKIYFLQQKGNVFLYVKGVKCENGVQNVGFHDISDDDGIFLSEKVTKNLLEAPDFSSEDCSPILIADDPGCGKTMFLNKLAIDLKEKSPNAWISFIDLNFFARPEYFDKLEAMHSSNTLHSESAMGFLLSLLSKRDFSLEKKLFERFSQRKNKMAVMFDGFDEICPKYKECITAFLKSLVDTGTIKVCVTTRLHEKHDLERSLKSVAYKLTPFSNEEQIFFLNSYWNALLSELALEEKLERFANMGKGVREWVDYQGDEEFIALLQRIENVTLDEIEGKGINLVRVAEKLLERSDHFVEGDEHFSQTPLHIQMLGLIVFEESFSFRSCLNLGHLYQRFFELKVKIFHREKVKDFGNVSSAKSSMMAREGFSEFLEKLAANVFMERRVYKLKKKDIENALSVGFVTEREGHQQFVHRTFGEFFFSKWLLRKCGKSEVTIYWLEKLYFDDGLSRVVTFLEDELSLKDSRGDSESEDEDSDSSDGGNRLNSFCLPEDLLQEKIHRCIFALVLCCFRETFQLFIDSFGHNVVTLLDKECEYGDWVQCEECVLNRVLTRYNSLNQGVTKTVGLIPFMFSCHCAQINPTLQLSTKTRVNFVIYIFRLTISRGLGEQMSEKITQLGLRYFFPYDEASCVYFCVNLVKVLVENRKYIKAAMMSALLNESNSIIVDKLGRLNMEILILLAESFLDESERVCWFLEMRTVFRLWLGVLSYSPQEEVECFWRFVERNLRNEEQLVKFLKMNDHFIYNGLIYSMYNTDSRVMDFTWQLIISHVSYEDSKSWLFEMFTKPNKQIMNSFDPPPRFYTFLGKLLRNFFISEVELISLLMPKDANERNFLLRFNVLHLPGCLLSFHKFITRDLKDVQVVVWNNFENMYGKMIFWVSEYPERYMDDDLRLIVEKRFDKMADFSESFRWMKESLAIDEDGFTKYRVGEQILRPEVLKSFILMFHDQLAIDLSLLRREESLKRLRFQEYAYEGSFGNIFQHLVESKFYFLVPFVTGILLKFLTKYDVETLLCEVNEEGNTVFHSSALDRDMNNWGVFYDVSRTLFGVDALHRVHSAVNNEGETVQDIFLADKSRHHSVQEKPSIVWKVMYP